MSRYAMYYAVGDPPYQVIGWYDTGLLDYPNLPPEDQLLEVSDGEWNSRGDSNLWGVTENLSLVPMAQPIPILTTDQAASAAISAGVTISLSGSVTLDPTLFPTDPTTQTKISSVVTTINTTGKFPGGTDIYPMRDAAGGWHSFTIDAYLIIAGAIADYISTLYLIADGNPFGLAALPSSNVNLVV